MCSIAYTMLFNVWFVLYISLPGLQRKQVEAVLQNEAGK
jgi:hypothetical protein